MKNVVLGITLAIASTLSNANNSKFEKYVIDYANSNGFMGCEQKIKSTFEKIREDGDFRLNVNAFDELKSDSLKVTAAWGTYGDSIFLEAEFRKNSGKCFVTQTLILSFTQSCAEFNRKNREFEHNGDVADFSWFTNKRRTPLYLKPLNGGCIAIYQNDSN